MTQKIIPFVSVCQMSDNRSGEGSVLSEEKGYGSGGNRCTESCNAGIAWQLNLAGVRSRFANVEKLMYWFTELRNHGSDVSTGRNGQEVVDWVNANGGKMWAAPATFAGIKAMVDAGNVGMGGFGDYNKLKLVNGNSPYSWQDPNGDGHVLMVVGYDDSNESVCVHDSLIGTDYQPQWYSFASFVAAKFDSLGEVQMAGFLPDYFTTNSDGTITCKSNGIHMFGAILSTYMADPDPLANWGLPTSAEIKLPKKGSSNATPVYRMFERGDIWFDPDGANDSVARNKWGCYRGHVDRNAGAAAIQAQLDQVNKEKAADDAEISQLQAQIAAGNGVSADLKASMLAFAKDVAPIIDAYNAAVKVAQSN